VAADLVAYYDFIPSGSDVDREVAWAARIRSDRLASQGIPDATQDELEWLLAAHACALRFPDGRRTRESIAGVASTEYGGKLADGLTATPYGQAALDLEPKLEQLMSGRAELVFVTT